MRYANYMVVDGNGYECTDGVQPHEAHRVAQQIADRRGEPVWLCPSGAAGDVDADEECDTPDGERIDPAPHVTYSIRTLSGRGLPTEVDADGYDTREAAEEMADAEHDGAWEIVEETP